MHYRSNSMMARSFNRIAQALRIVLTAFVLSGGAIVEAQTQAQDLVQQGEQALAARRYGEAAEAFEKAAKLMPGVAEIRARLGLIYFQTGKFAAAIPALQQAIKLKPSLPNLDILLSMCLSETGRLAESLPGLEKGFRRSTDPALKRMSGLQLQRAYTGLRRDSKAVDIALELVRLYPDDAEVLYHSSRLFGNYAYLTLRRLTEVAPDSVWRHQAAGEANESQGNLAQALAEYERVIALDPNRPGIHYRMGRVHLAQPQGEGQSNAAKEFEEETRVDATNANAWYELGEIHRKQNNAAKAREFFQKAVDLDPEFEEAQLGLGGVLLTLNQAENALTHLRKAVALNPSNDVAHYRLAQVHRQMGNVPEQQKELGEFRRLRAEKAKREPAIELRPRRDVTRQTGPEGNPQ